MKTKKKVFTKNVSLFPPNSSEDLKKKKRSSPKIEVFLLNSSEDQKTTPNIIQRSDTDQSQIIGGDAEVDHSRIIGGDAVKLLQR